MSTSAREKMANRDGRVLVIESAPASAAVELEPAHLRRNADRLRRFRITATARRSMACETIKHTSVDRTIDCHAGTSEAFTLSE